MLSLYTLLIGAASLAEAWALIGVVSIVGVVAVRIVGVVVVCIAEGFKEVNGVGVCVINGEIFFKIFF